MKLTADFKMSSVANFVRFFLICKEKFCPLFLMCKENILGIKKHVNSTNNIEIFTHLMLSSMHPDLRDFLFVKVECIQFSSVSQSCPTLCDPMNRSTPGLSVHHQLLEFTQTHVHWVSDAIQPSHPLSSPSPSALNLSQHQGLFKWVSSLHKVAEVLEFQL